MSLSVVNAHMGSVSSTRPHLYASLEEFRRWVAKEQDVEIAHQILLTPQGKQVKLHTLAKESKIFLYDRSVLTSSDSASTLFSPTEKPAEQYAHVNAPKGAPKSETLSGLQSFTESRRAWSQTLLSGSRSKIKGILQKDRETKNVMRATSIAVTNAIQHVETLRPKYEETRDWASGIIEDQDYLLLNWKTLYNSLADVPLHETFAQCLKLDGGPVTRMDLVVNQRTSSLQHLADIVKPNDQAVIAKQCIEHFRINANKLDSMFSDIAAESTSLQNEFDRDERSNQSDLADQASLLLEEIEVLSQKLGSDLATMRNLQDNAASLQQASKIVHLHGMNFMPSLEQASHDFDDVLDQATKQNDHARKISIVQLQKISTLESDISQVHSRLALLDVDEPVGRAFDILNFVVQLSVSYGLHLVEYIRRYEWDSQNENTSLPAQAEDTLIAEETKRRSRWTKRVAGILQFTSDVADTALRLVRERDSAMLIDRDGFFAYIACLRKGPGSEADIKVILEAWTAWETASKQHKSATMTFRNGSLQAVASGKAFGHHDVDDQTITGLRHVNSRIDEKLKSAESRVRKLEDLLHRQAQGVRPSSAGGFSPSITGPTFERYSPAPVTNLTSALSKARGDEGIKPQSNIPFGGAQNDYLGDKNLAQRIVVLEAELATSKAHARASEKTVASKQSVEESLKREVQEALAIKEDLLSNMETRQREFEDERRILKDENNALKAQQEDFEDELDRMQDSHVLKDEFVRLHERYEESQQVAAEEKQILEIKIVTLTQRIADLETQEQAQAGRTTELESGNNLLAHRLQEAMSLQAAHQQALCRGLLNLQPEVHVPEDMSGLIVTLEETIEAVTVNYQTAREEFEELQRHCEKLEARLTSRAAVISELEHKVQAGRDEHAKIEQALSLRDIEDSSRQAQLESITEERDVLQSELDSTITERDTLRYQVNDSERHGEVLETRLADVRRQVGEVTASLEEKTGAYASLQHDQDRLVAVRELQADKAALISQRLHIQQESLVCLLEQVGFIVGQQDSRMTVQKAPRATGSASASTTLHDQSGSILKRSTSTNMPTLASLPARISAPALHWADASTADRSEELYTKYVQTIDLFDMDMFNEAMIKRVKDIEHVARKWQREARSYRGQAHKYQNEAHERIALRSFQVGDLALFLPTRDQATKPWAAFNVGAPHYFLREQDGHRLARREWLIARISKVEERVVDLSQSIRNQTSLEEDRNGRGKRGDQDDDVVVTDENPYELSDGLRWFLVDAAEERPGAPINIGSGKATVAIASNEGGVVAANSTPVKKAEGINAASKTLTRSLDSRRSSTNSRKGLVAVVASHATSSAPGGLESMLQPGGQRRRDSTASSRKSAAEAAKTTTVSQQDGEPLPPGSEATVIKEPHHDPLRIVAATTATSPKRKPRAWDSLWSMDMKLESGHQT